MKGLFKAANRQLRLEHGDNYKPINIPFIGLIDFISKNQLWRTHLNQNYINKHHRTDELSLALDENKNRCLQQHRKISDLLIDAQEAIKYLPSGENPTRKINIAIPRINDLVSNEDITLPLLRGIEYELSPDNRISVQLNYLRQSRRLIR